MYLEYASFLNVTARPSLCPKHFLKLSIARSTKTNKNKEYVNEWMNDRTTSVVSYSQDVSMLHLTTPFSFKKLKTMPGVGFEAWLRGRKRVEQKRFPMPRILAYGLLITVSSMWATDPLSFHPSHCLRAIKGLLATGNLISLTQRPWEEQEGSLQPVKSSWSSAWEIALTFYQSCLHFAALRG